MQGAPGAPAPADGPRADPGGFRGGIGGLPIRSIAVKTHGPPSPYSPRQGPSSRAHRESGIGHCGVWVMVETTFRRPLPRQLRPGLWAFYVPTQARWRCTDGGPYRLRFRWPLQPSERQPRSAQPRVWLAGTPHQLIALTDDRRGECLRLAPLPRDPADAPDPARAAAIAWYGHELATAGIAGDAETAVALDALPVRFGGPPRMCGQHFQLASRVRALQETFASRGEMWSGCTGFTAREIAAAWQRAARELGDLLGS